MQRLLSVDALQGNGFGPVDLILGSGECVALLGSSGAGKSRLLRGIADLDPCSGRVAFEDRPRDGFRPSEWRRTVALLPPESGWWSDVVADHFPATPEGLRDLDLPEEAMQWEVSRLSSGERQRLGLLRMLALRPRVLLLDEPTANLDPGSTERVERLLRERMAEWNAAAIWVTHDAGQAERVAQRTLTIDDGRLR